MSNSNFVTTAAAIHASSQASAAAAAARAAQSAAEENLETKARFVVLPLAKFDKQVAGTKMFGLLNKYMYRLVGISRSISIKTTDIANLEQRKDDFGNTYTFVNLEGRSEVFSENNDRLTGLCIPMSLSDVTDILNGIKKYESNY